MNMNEYNDIRRLLNRWYDGVSTPADQQRLEAFFAEDGALPDDLAMERELFRAMTDAVVECPEMPSEISRRINSALEADMVNGHKSRHKPLGWRRRAIVAWGAAACLAALLMIPFLKSGDKATIDDKAAIAVTETTVAKPDPADTMLFMTPELPQSAVTTVKKGLKNLASAKKEVSRNMLKRMPVEADSDEDLYLSEEEEERLAASNYHVVTDEREANAILGTVFVRLESGMTEEGYRISDVSARYEMEMNDIYNL